MNTEDKPRLEDLLDYDSNLGNEEYLEFSNKNVYNVNSMTDKKKNIYKIIIVALIFFVAGFVLSDILNKGGAGQSFLAGEENESKTEENIEEEREEEKIPPIDKEKVSLQTRDQLFGDSVLVFDITLNKTSWIAVYEDINGEPGNILGAAVLDKGNVLSHEIELLRNTVGDSKYYIKIHPDDGDREFDHKKDLPLENIIYSFKTTSGRPN